MPQSVLTAPAPATPAQALTRQNLLWLLAFVPAVLFIHGFHPFADDAAIYVAGIRKLLHPALFQVDAPFVLANTHLSVFAHVIAGVVRVTRLPLTVVLLATHLVSIYAFVLAAWCIACRVFRRTPERWFAVAFAAACFTLPAAGTALVLMDPYVTSRSFSTPFGLLAVAAVMGRRWRLAIALLVLTALMHPLMAVFAAALVLLYATIDRGGLRAAVWIGIAAVAATGILELATRHIPVSAAYVEAVHSAGRTYYYPTEWRWYEDLGFVAPLVLYALAARFSDPDSRARKLCQACVVLGVSSGVAAFLFVHVNGPYLLVRLQLLRSSHIYYCVGVVLAGGWLSRVMWRRPTARWLLFALVAIASAGLYAAQRATFPSSAHIEWPGEAPRNPWAQAYVWIRRNTPEDAVFAANPDLNFMHGVDAQGFRATAMRSLLANDKDQGVAAVVNPSIAGIWAKQRDAQLGIDTMTDAERIARLKPFGVTWLLLKKSDWTEFPCPYENAVAKVCRMVSAPGTGVSGSVGAGKGAGRSTPRR